MALPDKEKIGLKEMLDQIIEGKVSANRRYVDQVLELIQDRNHKYYLERMIVEAQRAQIEAEAGNMQRAYHHKILAQTYKDILEKAFGVSDPM